MASDHLPDLSATLSKLRGRITRYRSDGKTIGEENTKINLIEPVLAALGWDVHELDEVRREYKVKRRDKPVDYGLFAYRTPLLFVEAKSLEQDVSDRKWISQIVGYATVAGVEWCVLTNGDEYRVYNSHAPVSIDEKLFRKIRLSDRDQDDLAVETLSLLSKDSLSGNALSLLWKAHHVDRQVVRAIEKVFAQPKPSLIRLLRAETKGLTPRDIKTSLQRLGVRADQAEPVRVPKLGGTRKRVRTGRRRQVTGRGRGVSVQELISGGLIKPPMPLEVDYKGHHMTAQIQRDGSVVFEGKSYESLSMAGAMARKTIIGVPKGRQYPPTNGWKFWRYRDERSEDLKPMETLRDRLQGRKAGQASAPMGHLRVVKRR